MKEYKAIDYVGTVIHCPTKELAKKVCKIANLGDAGFANNYWKYYKEEYCINLYAIMYGGRDIYKEMKIIPAEEFIKTHTQSEIVEDFQIY